MSPVRARPVMSAAQNKKISRQGLAQCHAFAQNERKGPIPPAKGAS